MSLLKRITLEMLLDIFEGSNFPKMPTCESLISKFPLWGEWCLGCPVLMLCLGVAARWQCFRTMFSFDVRCEWQKD